MKKLKRIFSALTAMATLLTSAVTVSAETTETERKYDISLVEEIAGKKIIFEEGNITVFEDGEIQDISYDYLYMNYIVPIGDETITPDILGLSAEYKFFNNSFADKYDGMKTYSVRVQTREELDKLYEDSAKLLEDGVIANAYKEVGYSYCCTNNDGGGNMIITVWDDSIDYDVSAMEELEGFDVVRDEEEPEKYVVAYADIFEYIKLRDVSESIESNENVKRLQFKNESGGMLFCAVAHMPYKRTYLIEDFETEETTEPLSEPATELTVNTSVTTETFQYVPPVTSVTEITDPTEQPTEDTSSEYSGAEVYDGNAVVFDDGEDVLIFDDYIHLTHSRYDFKMSYIMLHNDGIVTPEWFGLSDDYVLEQTGYDDTTETYTVTVETQEELDRLYQASAELFEKGIIENAYKQFEYTYNNTDCGEGFITLKEEDPDFDLSFAEGLEDITVQSYSSDPKMYSLICSDLNDVAALERAEETIKANENVAEFGMTYNYCTVVLPPTVLRTYLISEQELPETTDPTEQPTASVTTVPSDTTTADNKVDVSLIENITGEEVIYTDGNYICLSGGEGQRVIGCYYRMAYMIKRTDSIITPEYFGLSDDYEFVANFPTSDDEEFDVYTVAVESQEELDRLYEESAELLEKGIIKNAYKQYEYEYGCSPYGSSYAYYVLKDENAEFELNAIEGLEDFEVVQSENDPKKYIIEYTDAFEYIKLKEATDIIEANENIEEYSILCISCSALHVAMKKDEYLIEESETEETTDPTEQPTESVTTTPSEVQEGTEEVIFDANGDQKFNIRDCAFIASKLASGLADELPETADYNKDGKVNVRDAAGMAKYLASTVKKPIPNPNSSL